MAANCLRTESTDERNRHLMISRLRLLHLVATLAVTCLLLSCGKNPGSPSSTVTGKIEQASFPSPVVQLTVIENDGTSAVVHVDAAGRFSLKLAPQTTYRVFAGADGATIPLVVRTDGGLLGASIDVKSAGASVDVGSVRYWAGSVTPYARRIVLGSQAPVADSCVDGTMMSGQPCAVDSATVTCPSDDADDEDGDRGDETGGEGDGGVDCQDGIDPQGNPCDGGPSANGDDGGTAVESADEQTVDGAQPIAVVSLNLPHSVSCANHEEEHRDGEDHGKSEGDGSGEHQD